VDHRERKDDFFLVPFIASLHFVINEKVQIILAFFPIFFYY